MIRIVLVKNKLKHTTTYQLNDKILNYLITSTLLEPTHRLHDKLMLLIYSNLLDN